jgi:phosphate transport system substrate-binding protein
MAPGTPDRPDKEARMTPSPSIRTSTSGNTAHGGRRHWRRHTGAFSAALAATMTVVALTGAPATAGAASAKVTVPPPATGTATVTETGSSLLYPLWNLWGPGYTKQWPNITITTASTGSGTGISSALAGTSNIGASDAYLSPVQLATNKNAMNIPLAISSQVVAYNLPGLTKPLNLSGPVLSGIYRGKITKWNARPIAAINKGQTLPSTPIVTIHRADSSGDTFLFTSYLSKTDPVWGRTIQYGTTVNWPSVPGALGETGNSGMLQGAQSTPGSIAYIGISYLAKINAAGLGYANLKNKAKKYVRPTPATVAAAAASFTKHTPPNGVISMINSAVPNGYPIVNYEYAIVVKNQTSTTTAQNIRSVLTWAISPKGGNASSYLNQVNFQPLPAKVVAQSVAQIKKIK